MSARQKERAVIFGLEGLALSGTERAFFGDVNPWGYILFARNIDNPEQLLQLTNELRDLSGRPNLPILIDQEGGRVARLRPPHWRKVPPNRAFGDLWQTDEHLAKEGVFLNARLLAHELKSVGINVDCVPMLDVAGPGANEVVIGDRAWSGDPHIVTSLGREQANGILAGGVLPVIKHLPGHGRSRIDSHDDLPVVDATLEELEVSDFIPFRALRDLPIGMTGHLIFTSIDQQKPSTLSRKVIDEAIRSEAPGRIGFGGLLLTDDLSMGALKSDYATRAREALEAGCDIILHCNGDMAEMRAVASEIPALAGKSAERADIALGFLRDPEEFDADAARNRVVRDRYDKSNGRATLNAIENENVEPLEDEAGQAPTASHDDASSDAAAELSDSVDDSVEALLAGADGPVSEGTLMIDVEGYEGPLDMLLGLARAQKVDITKISILALAEQFLEFIEEAKKLKLELAADYLVMAAWLAYMKSRLLLPSEGEEDEPTGEELAARLAFQLQRLQAMRNVAAKLFARNRLGRDLFQRGAPEGIRIVRKSEYSATLYELLKAYSEGRIRAEDVEYKVERPIVLAIEDARRRLEAILGRIPDWSRLDDFLPTGVASHHLFGLDPDEAGAIDGAVVARMRRSARASTFTAGLELARDGYLEIRQSGHFEPIYVRQRKSESTE